MQAENWQAQQVESRRPARPSGVTPLRGPVQVYLDGLARTTRDCVRGRLDTIAGLLSPGSDATSLPWWELTYRETTLARSLLSDRYSWQTANNYLYALKGVLRESFRLGLMSAENYHRAVSFQQLKGKAVPAGRQVHPDEFRALFAHLAKDRSVLGIRDLAMLATLRATGMRRAELLGLQVEDYDPTECTLRVLGKGNREREVGAARWLAPIMADWLKIRGHSPGAMFPKVHHGGAIDSQRRPLTPFGLNHVLKRRLERAGVAAFNLHDFRRTLASELLDAGADISAVQRQLGHANVQTTVRYDRRPLQRVRQAVQLVADPFEAGTDA